MVKIEIELGIFFFRYYNILLCGDHKYAKPVRSEGFGLDKLFSENKLEIMGVPIKYVNSTRFLGVVIDDELSWLPQIQKLTQKLNCQIGAITRIKANIPRKFHKDLYTLFESHMSYCLSVWGGIKVNKLEPLFIAQKSCVRKLFGKKRIFRKI